MEVARITVSSVYAKAETAMPITSGMIGARVRMVYADPMWEGLKKTVVFYGAVVKDVVTDDELVEIPPECVSRPGVPLKIGVYGVDAAGNTVIPTVVVEIGRVKQGADPSGDTSTDKTLPVWAEVRAAIGDLDTLDTEDKSSLVAAVNEVMDHIADLEYEPVKITKFQCTPDTAQIGSCVNQIWLLWNVSKTPTVLTLDDVTMKPNIQFVGINMANLTGDKTWTLRAADERGAEARATASLTFLNGVYYGVGPEPESVDSAFVLGLTMTLSGDKVRRFQVTAGEGEYIWYCLPSRFGSCQFSVGGFDGGFDRVAVIDFQNSYGFTESYDVYRSANAGLGNTKVGVT